MTYTRTAGLLKQKSTVIFIHFAFFFNRKGQSSMPMHQGLKICCFSCVIQPIEIVYKSGNNWPTFTTFDSFIAKYVSYENQWAFFDHSDILRLHKPVSDWLETLPHRISGLNM